MTQSPESSVPFLDGSKVCPEREAKRINKLSERTSDEATRGENSAIKFIYEDSPPIPQPRPSPTCSFVASTTVHTMEHEKPAHTSPRHVNSDVPLSATDPEFPSPDSPKIGHGYPVVPADEEDDAELNDILASDNVARVTSGSRAGLDIVARAAAALLDDEDCINDCLSPPTPQAGTWMPLVPDRAEERILDLIHTTALKLGRRRINVDLLREEATAIGLDRDHIIACVLANTKEGILSTVDDGTTIYIPNNSYLGEGLAEDDNHIGCPSETGSSIYHPASPCPPAVDPVVLDHSYSMTASTTDPTNNASSASVPGDGVTGISDLVTGLTCANPAQSSDPLNLVMDPLWHDTTTQQTNASQGPAAHPTQGHTVLPKTTDPIWEQATHTGDILITVSYTHLTLPTTPYV